MTTPKTTVPAKGSAKTVVRSGFPYGDIMPGQFLCQDSGLHGMTMVAFQGQGGELPAAEWTLASVLKTGGYNTFFTGNDPAMTGPSPRTRRPPAACA